MHSCLSIAPGGLDHRLKHELGSMGLHLHEVSSPQAGLSLLAHFGFESILLDAEHMGWAGLDVLEALLRHTGAPVLVLGDGESERVRRAGLEAGAADWLAKPVSAQGIGSRLCALVRTAATPAPPAAPPWLASRPFVRPVASMSGSMSGSVSSLPPAPTLTLAGGLHIDRLAFRVSVNGRRLALSASQVELLYLLAERTGQVLSRSELHRLLDEPTQPSGRRIDTRISRLRRALGASPGCRWRLVSVARRGYRLEWAAPDTDPVADVESGGTTSPTFETGRFIASPGGGVEARAEVTPAT
jgi:two-component system, OmpR family, response regulator RstA